MAARREWRWALLAPLAVALAGFMMPGGEVPLFDDWDYRDTVEELLRTGRVALTDWPSVTFLAQLVWGLPFAALGGPTLGALRVSTLVATALGGVALYGAARRLRLAPRKAAFLALAMPFAPAAWLHANSYMTDLPGLALALALLLAGGRWFGGTRTWREGPTPARLLMFAGLTIASYLCRQTAALPGCALLAVLALRWPKRTLAWGVAPVAAALALHHFWLHELHGTPYFATWPRTDPSIFRTRTKFARRLADVALGVGFLGAPGFLALANRAALVRWRRDPRAWLGAVAGLALAGWAALGTASEAPLGDTLRDFAVGSFGELRGLDELPHAPLREHRLFQRGCQTLAGLGLAALGATLLSAGWRRWRAACRSSVPGMLLAAALAFLASLVAGMSIFDRYQIPLAALGGLLAHALQPARVRSRGPGWWACAALLAHAGIALVGVHDHFIRQAALQQGCESLLAAGVPATDINASLEFGGTHRFAPLYRPPQCGPRGRRPFLLHLPEAERYGFALLTPHQIFLHRRRHTVGFGPLAGHETLRTIAFRGWAGPGAVLLLKRVAPVPVRRE